jgi:cytochrome c oxidase subunit 4
MANESNGSSSNPVYTLPLVKAGPPHGPEAAAAAPTAHGGGHGHHGGADHVPHVLPLRNYILTWIALLILTALTVGASYVNFGSANILIALGIATIKATIVAMMFMHLRYDHKFHAIIFSFSLVFLAVFIVFTMYDTETRGRTDAVEQDRPANVKAPFKGATLEGRDEAKLKTKYGLEPDKPVPAPVLTPPN